MISVNVYYIVPYILCIYRSGFPNSPRKEVIWDGKYAVIKISDPACIGNIAFQVLTVLSLESDIEDYFL